MAVMLGVDVGGTKVAVGAVRRDGALVGEIREYESATGSTEELVTGVIDAIRDARERAEEDVLGVGLGSAGTIDYNRGLVVESPNLPLEDFPLAERVREALGLPVVLDNDANVATLAEVRVGAAQGFRHVIMLTLGTGVGGGIVLDGRLYRGTSGSAGELGHTIVRGDEDSPCLCGGRGCLEIYASGTALERYAREIVDGEWEPPAMEPEPGHTREGDEDYGRELDRLAAEGRLTGREIGELARQGDPAARHAVDRVAQWLGIGLANFANIFNPDMIVVGGGLGSLGELLLDPAREVMRRSAIEPNGEVAKVSGAALGNRAGVVGAALVAWEELEGDEAGDDRTRGDRAPGDGTQDDRTQD